ncbi:hypothetical protein CEK26_000231 [Fusarium fujikuroi]|uniref:DUF2828 domain-containing protein n=1 Tax=Fusarium fujikuroi TaxID=5127 RepID=A0A5Q3CUG2_FUSFU|nr:hypothetical protein CEK27_000228 [Fusarium fujikuroi]QGI75321.1 hypothetical protein CEK25_000227 [Fusarium fujikuroi]QGI89016.1 hypothetical protein CEK26_000231 [Fusarium fujikuroi]VTT62453.1 unnamed protein product [Fusarium fujikuroi]VTT74980.1 unnamed protein product [Fusarium fujikuroi]
MTYVNWTNLDETPIKNSAQSSGHKRRITKQLLNNPNYWLLERGTREPLDATLIECGLKSKAAKDFRWEIIIRDESQVSYMMRPWRLMLREPEDFEYKIKVQRKGEDLYQTLGTYTRLLYALGRPFYEIARILFETDPVYRALHLTIARLFGEQLKRDIQALYGDDKAPSISFSINFNLTSEEIVPEGNRKECGIYNKVDKELTYIYVRADH